MGARLRPSSRARPTTVAWAGNQRRGSDVIDQRMVHGDFVIPGVHQGCNSDANPEAYVVAVERSSLPEAPFDVQLDVDDPPLGAPEERTTVTEDLRSPGATIPG